MKRFPLGLTLAASLAFAILIGLGVWQVHRLAWKEDLLARVAALRAAPPRPLAEILGPAARGKDVEYRRVSVDCLPPYSPPRPAFRYALRDGQVGWRLISPCRLPGPTYDGILADRGLVRAFSGAMAPGVGAFAPPAGLVGVLRSPGGAPLLGPAETAAVGGNHVYRVLDAAAIRTLAKENGIQRPAPYILSIEAEEPPPAGVTPAALPEDIPNNHFVYALTWFALAAILAWFYGAMLIRRLNGP